MKYLSLCDGIGAAHVWEEELQWRCVGASEIAAFPKAVVRHHKPHIPELGDMTKHHEWSIEHPDLICGGTPCQSFSVAGLRGGLADPRGNLALVFLGIVDQHRPKWVVWENVPGVYSSNSHNAPDPRPPFDDVEEGEDRVVEDSYDADEDHAFACFLAGLSELGYGIAYRTLNAQYFGVAQRRRRVFVVGYLGDWRPATAVLFEPESLSGHPAPSKRKGERPAPTITSRPSGGGGLGTDFDLDGGLIPEVANPLTHRMGKGVNTTMDEGQTMIIAFPERMSATQCAKAENIAPAIGATNPTAVAMHQNQRGEVRSTEVCGALGTGGGKPGQGFPCAQVGMVVRRLTPRECECLQAFPDDYTMIPWGGRSAHLCPDGLRYKALGNSWARVVPLWIGRRIQKVEDIKQSGEWVHADHPAVREMIARKKLPIRMALPGGGYIYKVGKDAAGRLLDGIDRNGFPS